MEDNYTSGLSREKNTKSNDITKSPSNSTWDSTDKNVFHGTSKDNNDFNISENGLPLTDDISAAIYPQKVLQFEFNGNAREYFKIWIVNTFLTLITLGIFSAWAKVRSNRYMYGNTQLAGASFDYLADPIGILKGRIIAAVLFAGYFLSAEFVPILVPFWALLFIVFLPWLIVRSMQFRLYNTAYRHLRFGFSGTYGQAFLTYIGLLFLVPLTAGLIFPYIVYRRNRYLVNHTYYGNLPFNLKTSSGSFYGMYLAAGIMLVIAVAVAAGITSTAGGLQMLFQAQEQLDSVPQGMTTLILAAGAWMYLAYLFVWIFLDTSIKNHVFTSTYGGTSHLESKLSTATMFWLYITNTFAILCSLGLMVPWAKIRVLRYRLQRLKVCLNEPVEKVQAARVTQGSATGEGVSDVFEVDFGI